MKNLLLITFLVAGFVVQAQSNGMPMDDYQGGNPADSVSDAKLLRSALRILREFRIQAYVQVEWQRADSGSYEPYGSQGTNYVGSAQGGTFPLYANNRFLLRRGRFKLSYEHVNKKDLKVMDFAFQFDATNVYFTIKDFYGRIIDPWIGWFSIQGGVFLRPFGFESPAPPSFHESPEFSRVNQNILPNECELGEVVVIESPAKFQTVYLRLDAGLVNGNGIDVGAQTGAYESRKDFIGRIKVAKMWPVGRAKLGFNASGSYYNGGVLQTDPNVWVAAQNGMGQWEYVNIGIDSLTYKKNYKREYYDGELQLKADYGIGTTMVRGEYIAGIQPGTQTSSSVPTGNGNGPPAPVDLYLRRFNGAMFYLTQSFKNKLKSHTMMHDITVKYDWYTPQAQVPGKDLNFFPAGFTPTDIKYTTIGIGYSFIPYNFFKLMIWYDIIINESTAIPYWTSNYKGNNILTIRTQFYVDTWWFNPKSKYVDNQMQRTY